MRIFKFGGASVKDADGVRNLVRVLKHEGTSNTLVVVSAMGKMTNATCKGRITGTCGDSMEIYLRIRNDHIQEASFFTEGCGASVACGSLAAELASGKNLDEAAQIGGDAILEALGGLPEEEVHCAYLAAETLQVALHEWMSQGSKAEEK